VTSSICLARRRDSPSGRVQKKLLEKPEKQIEARLREPLAAGLAQQAKQLLQPMLPHLWSSLSDGCAVTWSQTHSKVAGELFGKIVLLFVSFFVRASEQWNLKS
jgi:hypothetical protein